jgi:tetratricopeptide (TPR) repeat protein
MKLWFAASLLLAFGLSGCSCGKQSDEELLKERLDTTAVHVYLATKIAILKADQSPEAKAASEQLMRALEALQGKSSGGTSGAPRELGAKDYLELGKALFALRKEGKELLESGDEKGMAPFLPKLVPDAELAKVLDLPTEHALLLAGTFVLKLHPKSPLPLPVEIVLYEAWMSHTEDIKLEGLPPLVAAIKASVFGTNELCDLAKKEADWAESHKADQGGLSGSFGKLAGTPVAIDEKEAAQLNAAVRGIAHAATGTCFMNRDEQDKAVEELEKFVEAANEVGVPAGETAMIRAYIAYQKKDYAKAEKALVEARDYPGTPAESKKEIDELIEHVRQRKDGKIATYFGKAYFAKTSATMVVRRLDEAGVFDELKQSELFKTIDSYVSATGKAGDTLPTTDGVKEKGKKLLDKVTK